MPDTQRIHGFNLQFAKTILERNLATQEQVTECLANVASKIDGEVRLRQLPDLMVEKGYLTPEAADVLRKMVEGSAIPHEIAGYRIDRVLGQGGMGIVYKGTSVATGEPVALKVIRLSALRGQTTIERFRREARALVELRHPHIVRGIEVGEFEGSEFIAMEFAEGKPLHHILRESGPLPIRQALDVAIAMADALAYAHSKQMIHRDLKPNNIIVGDNSIKLLDFGLSKSSQDETANLTLPGMGMGTPFYMPPEQIRGAKTVDHRGDIYSLGASIYEAVTGHRPIDGKAMEVLVKLERGDPIVPPEQRRPDIPAGFSRILKRMLERDPADRYQSASDLLRELVAVRESLSGRPSPAAATEAAGEPAAVPADSGESQTTYFIRYKRPDGSRLEKPYSFDEIKERILSGRFNGKTICHVGEDGPPIAMERVPELAALLVSREETVQIKIRPGMDMEAFQSAEPPAAEPVRRKAGQWHPVVFAMLGAGAVLVILLIVRLIMRGSF